MGCTYILKAKKFAEPPFQSKNIVEKVRVIFGPFWVILGHSWAILGIFGPFRGIFGKIFGHGCGLPCKIGFIEFFFESQMYCFCPPIYKLHGLVQYAQPQHISPLSRKLPLTACALSVKVSP